MAYIISDNNFARDTEPIRLARLDYIAANIDEVAAELELEEAIVTWAKSAGGIYQAALIEQTEKQGESAEAYAVLKAKEVEMLERYQQLKELVISRFEEKTILQQYGVYGQTPRSRKERYAAALELVAENAEKLAAGDPRALPAGMVATLNALAISLNELEDSALEEKQTALDMTNSLQALFDADTDKLRVLYSWCASYWGKKNSKMMLSGFSTAK